MRANGIASVVIVSDPYHLARAAEMAEDLGVRVYMSATPTTRFDAGNKKKSLCCKRGMRYPSTVWKMGQPLFGMAV
ncbi:Periplasmic protein [Neisseria gonorrhoeae]|uniref:Periplasmic protein n=1 Tax=Neisseria gonorrhoeae TaxID=485 RepID=A0A378W4F6_NEIGO|nr:Periplasmic protein [Neisseria gonorrhoeae]